MHRATLPPLLLGLLVSSCATLAGDGKGDVDLASALSGPFRSLSNQQICDENDECTGIDELPQGTPNGLIKAPGRPFSRSPTVLVRGEQHVVLYAARDLDTDPDRIVRLESTDARDFAGDIMDVLRADKPFEGESMSDPWALEVGGEVWLYYAVVPPPTGATPGQVPGIVRARSTDGLAGRSFVKDDGPALGVSGADPSWEKDAPHAPSVIRLEDGSFRLFYASGDSIGEATSADGRTFTRLPGGPVLRPSATVDPATLPTGVKPPFDDLSVGDPCVDRYVTEAGRVAWRVLYTGRDRRDGYAVGYAGRYGDQGPLVPRPGSVFGGKLHGNAPAIARFEHYALLYANVDESSGAVTLQLEKQLLGIAITPARIRLSYP